MKTSIQELSDNGKVAVYEIQDKDGTVASTIQTFIGHALYQIESDEISHIDLRVHFYPDRGYHLVGMYLTATIAEKEQIEVIHEL